MTVLKWSSNAKTLSQNIACIVSFKYICCISHVDGDLLEVKEQILSISLFFLYKLLNKYSWIKFLK